MDKQQRQDFISRVDALVMDMWLVMDKGSHGPEYMAYSKLQGAAEYLRDAARRDDPVRVLGPEDEGDPWMVTTRPVGRLDGHDIAERARAVALEDRLPRISWDPESEQFWAYTADETTARTLAGIVETIVRAEYARVEEEGD